MVFVAVDSRGFEFAIVFVCRLLAHRAECLFRARECVVLWTEAFLAIIELRVFGVCFPQEIGEVTFVIEYAFTSKEGYCR